MAKPLEPGRELDVRIAELLGWEHHSLAIAPMLMVPPKPWGARRDLSEVRQLAGGGEEGPIPHLVSVPRFSTDIAAAWQVVEYLRSRGYGVRVDAPARAQYVCWIQPPHGPEVRGSVEAVGADTAPHAICLAAVAIRGAMRSTSS